MTFVIDWALKIMKPRRTGADRNRRKCVRVCVGGGGARGGKRERVED